MRADLEIIYNWIDNKASVLDLGCGEGELLKALQDKKQVVGFGLEIDTNKIQACLEKGLNVIEHNIDKKSLKFEKNSFDVVVMTQSMQALREVKPTIANMLEVGKSCVLTFPNFGNWRCRLYLSLLGKMPVSKFMPYQWHNTPNIHFCTITDFEILATELKAKILKREVINAHYKQNIFTRLMPNLFGTIAIYHLSLNEGENNV